MNRQLIQGKRNPLRGDKAKIVPPAPADRARLYNCRCAQSSPLTSERGNFFRPGRGQNIAFLVLTEDFA